MRQYATARILTDDGINFRWWQATSGDALMNTDSEIQDIVTDALEWDSAVDSSKLTVSVRDNIATLRGEVSNYSERMEARRATHCVAGVRSVIDRIDVVPMDSSSDALSASAVMMAWVRQPCLTAS
jgi:hypothetical protein